MRKINHEIPGDELEARRYPSDWSDLRRRLIDATGGRCRCSGECRREECKTRDGDCGKAEKAGFTLQIAHLDDTPEHLHPDNLRVMCRACHLSYDNARKRGAGIVRESSVRVHSDHSAFEEKAAMRAAAWAEIDPPNDGWLWLPFSGAGDLLLEHWRTAPRPKRWWWSTVAASDHDAGAVGAFRERFPQVDLEERRANKVLFRTERVFCAADIDAYADVDALQAVRWFMRRARLARRVALVLTMPSFSFSRSRMFDLASGHVVTNRMLRDEIRADPRPRLEAWLRGQAGVVSLRQVGQSAVEKRRDKVHYLAYVIERESGDEPEAPAAAATARPAAHAAAAPPAAAMPPLPEIPWLVQ